MGEPDYVSLAKAAKYLNVSRTTIWAWIKNGKLPAIRIGRNYRVKISDLNLMIQK